MIVILIMSMRHIKIIDIIRFRKVIKMIDSTKEKVDAVNNPSHYHTGQFECIDVMIETQGVESVKSFCLCNAFKYIYRHNGKNGLEDIKKAQYYINKYIELTEG